MSQTNPESHAAVDYSDAERWTQDGSFPDVDGNRVSAHDDVVLLSQTLSENDLGIEVPAGTVATVLFHCGDGTGLLQLEVYPEPQRVGAEIAYARPSQVRLHQTNEQKYPR